MKDVTQKNQSTDNVVLDSRVNDLADWYEIPNSEEAINHMNCSNVVPFATGLWS